MCVCEVIWRRRSVLFMAPMAGSLGEALYIRVINFVRSLTRVSLSMQSSSACSGLSISLSQNRHFLSFCSIRGLRCSVHLKRSSARLWLDSRRRVMDFLIELEAV